MSIQSDFKTFITKGNIIQLAIAFVMGMAFSAVVTALVTDFVDPLIGLAGGTSSLSALKTCLGSACFGWGAFLSAAIDFIIVALILFFAIVYPMLRIQARQEARKAKAPPTTKSCPFCDSTISIKAIRCPNCTASLPAPEAPPAPPLAAAGPAAPHS